MEGHSLPRTSSSAVGLTVRSVIEDQTVLTSRMGGRWGISNGVRPLGALAMVLIAASSACDSSTPLPPPPASADGDSTPVGLASFELRVFEGDGTVTLRGTDGSSESRGCSTLHVDPGALELRCDFDAAFGLYAIGFEEWRGRQRDQRVG
jgi:hypothetical protein